MKPRKDYVQSIKIITESVNNRRGYENNYILNLFNNTYYMDVCPSFLNNSFMTCSLT